MKAEEAYCLSLRKHLIFFLGNMLNSQDTSIFTGKYFESTANLLFFNIRVSLEKRMVGTIEIMLVMLFILFISPYHGVF